MKIFAIVAALAAFVCTVSALEISDFSAKKECFSLGNPGEEALDLAGYTVSDSQGHDFTFVNLTLGAGESITVCSRKGTDGNGTVYMNNGRDIWNNDGDNCTITSPEGEVIASYSYGRQKAAAKAQAPAEEINSTVKE